MELHITAVGTREPKMVFIVKMGGHTGEWEYADMDKVWKVCNALEVHLGEPHVSIEVEDVSMTGEWTFTEPEVITEIGCAMADILGEPHRSTENPDAMSVGEMMAAALGRTA